MIIPTCKPNHVTSCLKFFNGFLRYQDKTILLSIIYSELHQAFILKSRIASRFTWGFIMSLDGSKTCSLYKWWSFTTPQISTLFSRELEAPTDFYQSVPILLSRALHRREQGLLNAGTRFHEDVSCLPEVYFKGIRQYTLCTLSGCEHVAFSICLLSTGFGVNRQMSSP